MEVTRGHMSCFDLESGHGTGNTIIGPQSFIFHLKGLGLEETDLALSLVSEPSGEELTCSTGLDFI